MFTFSRVPNLLLITLVLSYYRLYVTKILLCGGGGVTIATSTTQKQSKFLAKFSSFFFNKQVAAEENEIIFHSGIVSGKNNRSEQSPKQPVSEENISDLVSQMNFSNRTK